MQFIKSCKESCHNVLNFPYRKSSRIFNGFLIFFVLISISVVPVHLLKLEHWNDSALIFIEKILVTIFSFEYVLRVWVSKNPFRYIFSIRGLIDLLAILPYYLSLFISVENPQLFVLLRSLRLLKFDEVFASYSVEDHPEKELILHKSINIMPGEVVERIIQRHPIVFLVFSIMPLTTLTIGMLILFIIPLNIITIIISGLFFLASAILFFKNWLDQNYDIMLITKTRIIFQQREIFGAQSNAIAYSAITNVVLDNVGLLRWIFNYGNIKVETANREATLDYYYAPNPEKILNKISENRHHSQEIKTPPQAQTS